MSLEVPTFAGLCEQAAAHTDHVRDLVARLEPHQLAWRPGPAEWSVNECIDHLVVTGNLYVRNMIAALDSAPASATPRPFRPSMVGRILVRRLGPVQGVPRPVRAPAAFRPEIAPDEPLAGVRFLDYAARLGLVLERARDADLNRVRVVSPVTRLLRMSLGEAIWLNLAHEERHFQQIERVRSSPGFPA